MTAFSSDMSSMGGGWLSTVWPLRDTRGSTPFFQVANYRLTEQEKDTQGGDGKQHSSLLLIFETYHSLLHALCGEISSPNITAKVEHQE